MWRTRKRGYLIDRGRRRLAVGRAARQNLKAMLMDLGNRLLREHGFKPAQAVFDQQRDAAFLRSTQMIAMFIAWLNRVPDAQKILMEYGLEWPVGQFHGKATDDYVALD